MLGRSSLFSPGQLQPLFPRESRAAPLPHLHTGSPLYQSLYCDLLCLTDGVLLLLLPGRGHGDLPRQGVKVHGCSLSARSEEKGQCLHKEHFYNILHISFQEWFLALRTVTLRPLSYFLAQSDLLAQPQEAEYGLEGGAEYKAEELRALYHLVSHHSAWQ